MSAGTSRRCACALVIVTALTGVPAAALAQTPGTTTVGLASTDISTSGTTTVGFARASERSESRPPADTMAILPPGSLVPRMVRPLVEKVWLTSPTFRRQCARLREAAMPIAIYLDFPRNTVDANAGSEITRTAGLQATIHLRAGDGSVVEYLAHEIEHVLEQLDNVDLRLAVSNGVHGASEVQRSGSFETSRAVAIGRLVAREVGSMRNWR
jgi:hypothetical protein